MVSEVVKHAEEEAVVAGECYGRVLHYRNRSICTTLINYFQKMKYLATKFQMLEANSLVGMTNHSNGKKDVHV